MYMNWFSTKMQSGEAMNANIIISEWAGVVVQWVEHVHSMFGAVASVQDHTKKALDYMPVISTGNHRKMKNPTNHWTHRECQGNLGHMVPFLNLNKWVHGAWMIKCMCG